MAKEMWDEPCPVNVYSKNIYEAVENGHLEEVRYWFKQNPQSVFRGPNRAYFTPLYNAAFSGNDEIVKFLWEESNVYIAKVERKWRPLHWIRSNKCDYIKKLQRNFHSNFESSLKADLGFPLLGAAQNGNLEIVEYLVNNGCPLEEWKVNKKTALHLAAEKGYLDIVKFLVDRGANVNCKDTYGKTPLFYATDNGFIQIIRLLIDAKTDIHIQQYFTKETAFVYSIRNGSFNVIKTLLDAGSDINIKSCEGENMLFDATRYCSFNVVELLINRGIEVNCFDKTSGQTALYYAIMLGKLNVVRLLVESGANVNHIDNYKHSLFHYAAIRNNIACANVLLENGAVVHINNEVQHYTNTTKAVQDYLKSFKQNLRNFSRVNTTKRMKISI